MVKRYKDPKVKPMTIEDRRQMMVSTQDMYRSGAVGARDTLDDVMSQLIDMMKEPE